MTLRLFQLELFEVYVDNIDKPLHYSDSLAIVALNRFKRKQNSDYIDERLDDLILSFEFYEKLQLTYPVEIKNYGADLGAANAYQTLLNNGVSKEDARLSIELYGKRQEIIRTLRRQNMSEAERISAQDRQDRLSEKAKEVQYYMIQANQLGWINVDQFFYEEDAEEVKLIADFDVPADVDFFNVSLVLPEQGSYLTGHKNEAGNYHFTKDTEFYTKLPVGVKAYLVGIAYKDGGPILGMKEIVIGESELEKHNRIGYGTRCFQG